MEEIRHDHLEKLYAAARRFGIAAIGNAPVRCRSLCSLRPVRSAVSALPRLTSICWSEFSGQTILIVRGGG